QTCALPIWFTPVPWRSLKLGGERPALTETAEEAFHFFGPGFAVEVDHGDVDRRPLHLDFEPVVHIRTVADRAQPVTGGRGRRADQGGGDGRFAAAEDGRDGSVLPSKGRFHAVDGLGGRGAFPTPQGADGAGVRGRAGLGFVEGEAEYCAARFGGVAEAANVLVAGVVWRVVGDGVGAVAQVAHGRRLYQRSAANSFAGGPMRPKVSTLSPSRGCM